MARPRKRPAIVSTRYFEDVSPLWVAPGQPPIPERYHEAVQSLADWAGPDWPDNEKTYFFPIRSFLIDCHQRWLQYDWQADRDAIAEWRRGRKYQVHLVEATKRFCQALDRSSYKEAYRKLGLSIGAELTPDACIEMPRDEGISAVRRGMTYFASWVERPERFRCRFGCVEFDAPPARLPQAEVAIALSLADFVTGFRRDGFQAGSLCFPRPPQLSKNLPWKAIAQIVADQLNDPGGGLPPESIQVRVENLASRARRIHRFPD